MGKCLFDFSQADGAGNQTRHEEIALLKTPKSSAGPEQGRPDI
jgi:hypothetical protein